MTTIQHKIFNEGVVGMDNKDVAKQCFRYAAQEFSSANYLQGMRPIPVEVICYHGRQSVEKYLRGFIALKGGEVKKANDLVALNQICKQYDSTFSKIEEDCVNLSAYEVQAKDLFHLVLKHILFLKFYW